MPRPSTSIVFLVLLLVAWCVGAAGTLHGFKPKKVFVFGDSYADTGNLPKEFGGAWVVPYGITHPGKPDGRFTDGLLLTDYLAKFLRIHDPLPYAQISRGSNKLRRGINFAVGGSGVFPTFPGVVTMTNQIDSFEHLLNTTSTYTKNDVKSAAFLVTLAGNDYFLNPEYKSNPTKFIKTVVNQFATNLKRIKQLGVQKIIVAGIQPMGCLPAQTISTGYTSCIISENWASQFHNLLLKQAIDELNNGTSSPNFLLLDFYTAFKIVINTRRDYQGKLRFKKPLAPCCIGIGSGNDCGTVAANGTKLYTLCSDPSSHIFWDGVHPSQAGWRTVFTLVQYKIAKFLRL